MSYFLDPNTPQPALDPDREARKEEFLVALTKGSGAVAALAAADISIYIAALELSRGFHTNADVVTVARRRMAEDQSFSATVTHIATLVAEFVEFTCEEHGSQEGL